MTWTIFSTGKPHFKNATPASIIASLLQKVGEARRQSTIELRGNDAAFEYHD